MNEFTLIEAAGGTRPKIVGTAYSGGKMSLPGWKNPVVVDLSGMELPESVPLLANHENRTLAQRFPASSLLARAGAGCGSVGDVTGAWLASAPLSPSLWT